MVGRRWLWFALLLLPIALGATSYLVWRGTPWILLILAACAVCGLLAWTRGDIVANFAYAGGTGALLLWTITRLVGYNFSESYQDFWGSLLRLFVTAAVSGGAASALIILYATAREQLQPPRTVPSMDAIAVSAAKLRSAFRDVENTTKRERHNIESVLTSAQRLLSDYERDAKRLLDRATHFQRAAEDAQRMAAMSEADRNSLVRLMTRNRLREQGIAFVFGIISSLVANALWSIPRMFSQ